MALRPVPYLIVVICLLVSSSPAVASGLREEAIEYRTQGYEAQRRGDPARALSWYQKAGALDPTYATPQNDIGIILEEQGRLEEALRAYRQALAVSPNSLEAHANLAMLYERLGQQEQAIAHWLKRYQLGDPYDPWTARAEERLVALGVLKTYPGLKGALFSRRRVAADALQAHQRSLEEYRALTGEHGEWPPTGQ
jgi:tetratricopeptide (TPR) repeat protein